MSRSAGALRRRAGWAGYVRGMEAIHAPAGLVQLTPAIWQVPFPMGHVFLIRLDDGFAAVDTGLPGSGPAVLDALGELGGPLRQIVLTHAHGDHMGSAADLVDATGVPVLAGADDAPVIRGDKADTFRPFTDSERALMESFPPPPPDAPPPPPMRHVGVDVELRDGDTLAGWPERAEVLHVPGHTPGSIAIYLPESRVLFPGDTITALGGRVRLGPFCLDREAAIAGFHRLAALPIDTLCVPHGDPILHDAQSRLVAATPEQDWL
jgi:glyoxylase-like metal-dependent hydrolase (beta-lactamase superfamily II)